MPEAVVITGKLDSEELLKSIDNLVDAVSNKVQEMSAKFEGAMGIMKSSMKDFAVTQKVSVDLMKDAWRDMSSAFDAMVKAQETSKESSSKGKDPNTVEGLKEIIALEEQRRNKMELGTNELRQQNKVISDQRALLKEELMTEDELIKKIEKEEQAKKKAAEVRLKQAKSKDQSDLEWAKSLSEYTLPQAEKKLRELEAMRQRMFSSGLFNRNEIQKVTRDIDRLTEKINKLKAKGNTPILTMQSVTGMPERTLEEISRKMQAIAQLRSTLNYKTQANDITELNKKYAELAGLSNQIMGKNAQLSNSNNALARSFGYIRNRIVYAFTIGAVINFAKSLYNVRAEYEMLDRSIGILIGDMERGTQIFNELNEMALKSPFTLIELGTAAKQLTAYNFAADEVVDVTRRLADISAALGVPMERLTYNLGQIKAQGVLNARDARDFANAGFAIVPMLAQLYNTQKTFGDELVTTGKVYDMMSKKMVTYSDVLKVIYKATDEGGKFFDFQAKQADTLRVQLANLTLAFNNMLNEIGSEHQSALAAPIKGLKLLYQNWREVSRVLKTVILTFGVYKATAILSTLETIKTFGALQKWIVGIKNASGAMATFNAIVGSNPLGLLATALAAVIGYFVLFKNSVEEVSEDVTMFGEAGAKTLKRIENLRLILKGSEEGTSTYKNALSELSTIASEYGIILDAEKSKREEVNKAIAQTTELVKEESSERQRANMLAKGQENYEETLSKANKELAIQLKKASRPSKATLDPWNEALDEVRTKSEVIAEIVKGIVQDNIEEIANKQGAEYEQGIRNIFGKIQEHMRAIGISEDEITSEWMYKGLTKNVNIIDLYIRRAANAANAQDKWNTDVEKSYELSKKDANAKMTQQEKIDAAARAMRKNAGDANSLYNEIRNIVELANQKYELGIDLKLNAEQPPKWMLDMQEGELSKWARSFAALAKTGVKVKGHEEDPAYAAKQAEKYGKAYKKVQEDRIRAERAKDKSSKSPKAKRETDELLDALNNEISLVKKVQGEYDKLTKAGMATTDALELVQSSFKSTIEELNKVFERVGLPQIDLSVIKGKDPNATLAFFEKLRDELESKGLGNLKRMKVLEAIISELKVSAKTYNLDMITKGLNNELSKLKEEYELGVELDANPELGDMFTEIFGVDTTTIPRSFSEAYDKANDIAKKKLQELKVDVKGFDLMSTMIQGGEDGKWKNLEIDSKVVQDLLKWQNTFRDMFKKNMEETEKMLDDYVKKYGDYSDKVAEIEADRLVRIKKLNEAYYSRELRERPEYFAKLNAIEQGSQREKGQAMFDEFKNSQLYVAMFENLEYVSTSTLEAIRSKLEDLKNEMGTLSPEQLKQVTQQFQKIDIELIKRNPFKGLIKNVKDYSKAVGKQGKQAQIDFKNAQDNYDAQLKIVASLKERLENEKRSNNVNKATKMALEAQIVVEDEKLKKLKEELLVAQELNQKYDLMRQIFGEQAQAIAKVVQTISSNLQSLGELRDTLHDMFGVDLGNELNAVIDDLGMVGDGMNQIVSSAQSGNVVGVVTGTIKTIGGVGDAIASIFGDGAARTRRINREINNSRETVRQLNLAYQNLERAVEKSLGTAETEARRAAIANKEAELSEIERQIALEQSKRSKDRDEDAIKQMQETAQSLRHEIEDLKEDVVNNLWGSDVKSAAESFVDTWVQAWKAGETTLDAIQEKMEEMVANLVKKAMTSKIVEQLLKPLYTELDSFTQESSAGGVSLTFDELRQLAQHAGITAGNINTALGEFYGNLENLGIMMQGSAANQELSAMQQGIQGVTEVTANALEAYMNGVSQQVYYQSDVLTQIRDAMINFNMDVQVGTMSQILLQLQSSYTVQMSIQGILEGVLNPSGRAFNVELVS